MRNAALNLPNIVTLIRTSAIPVVLIFLALDQGVRTESVLETVSNGRIATIIFIFLALLDIVDGWLARKYDQVSTLGKLLDPLADKLLIQSVMILLVHLDRIPWWLTVLIIGREMAVSTLRGIAASDGIIIEALRLGKFKQTLFVIGCSGLMLYGMLGPMDLHFYGILFLYFGTLSAYLSFGEYLWKYLSAIRAQRH